MLLKDESDLTLPSLFPFILVLVNFRPIAIDRSSAFMISILHSQSLSIARVKKQEILIKSPPFVNISRVQYNKEILMDKKLCWVY